MAALKKRRLIELPLRKSASAEDDLAGRYGAKSEDGDVEAAGCPDLGHGRVVGIEVREVDDLEPDLGPARAVEQESERVADAAPVLGRLAVVDAPELERDQPVVLGDVVEVERWCHIEGVVRAAAFLTVGRSSGRSVSHRA